VQVRKVFANTGLSSGLYTYCSVLYDRSNPIHRYAVGFNESQDYATTLMRVPGGAYKTAGTGTGTGTTVTKSVSASAVDGDIAIIRMSTTDVTNTITANQAGWTVASTGSEFGPDFAAWTFYKVVSGDSGNWTWTLNSSASWTVIGVIVSNPAAGSVAGCPIGFSTGTGTSFTAASVSAGSMGLDVYFADCKSATLGLVWTDPAGPLNEHEKSNQRGFSNTRFPHRRNRSFLPF
jgi:hypothetical protein